MPRFCEGEKVLVFLREAERAPPARWRAGLPLQAEQALPLQVGVYEVSGLAQGKYGIFVDETGEKMVRNNFSNLCIQDVDGVKMVDEEMLLGKPLSEFVSEIKQVLGKGGLSLWHRMIDVFEKFDCASVAHAYEFIYSGGGNYLRWAPGDMPISYKISNWWLPDAVEPVGAVYAAFKTWEDVAGSSVAFNYQGTTSDTLAADEDGVNMIGWTAEGFIAGIEVPGTYGVMYWGWYDTETMYFDEVDIALNIYYQWTTTGGANKVDIQGVVTHEVGHMLGLDHTDWEVDLYYDTWGGYGYSPTEFTALYPERCECTMTSGPTFLYSHIIDELVMLRTLEADDIAGISVLYPPGYGSGGGGAGGGCFVVTAAYGTPFAKEVKILSRFRDELLLKNRPGELFVKTYYKVSPRIAKSIKNTPWLRRIVRLHLKPVVFIANLLVSDDIN